MKTESQSAPQPTPAERDEWNHQAALEAEWEADRRWEEDQALADWQEDQER